MKILLLAPHPFYQERGTPIAVNLLLKALSERNHTIDVLTYHEGSDIEYNDKIKIHRIDKPPLASGIRPGFSLKKLIADRFMLKKALNMVESNSYDLIHAVEESVFMAKKIKKLKEIPYVYDMDSSMPQQIADKLPLFKPLLPIMKRFERNAVQNAIAVVPMCDSLAELAKSYGAKHLTILRDISLIEENNTEKENLKEQLGIKNLLMLYLGNLESYQGIDLLLESFALLQKKNQNVDLVIAGGIEKDIAKYKKTADELGIKDKTHFIGPRPIKSMGALFKEADILVSPRTQGHNTPMKIYSYLASGKAILATDMPTHTQVLSSEVAILEKPDPESFAEGMRKIAANKDLRIVLGDRAKTLAEEKYTFAAYKKEVFELYDYIEQNLKA